jgi:hypothetical protein
MTVEFRIPISPTAHFFSNIRLAALSLRKLGRPYADFPIQVHVGDRANMTSVMERNRWSGSFPVRWRIVPHDQRHYLGTANDRFALPSDADVVICADADTCIVRPIDDLLSTLLENEAPAVAGLQAHISPFHELGAEAEDEWKRLFRHAGVQPPAFDCNYSLDPKGAMGAAPAYFNFGFVAFNRNGFEAVRNRVETHTLRVLPLLAKPVFQAQIGLAVAVAEAGLRVIQLSHEMNCANDDRLPEDLFENPSRVRVIHYLRRNEFDRARFLTDPKAYHDLIQTAKRNPVSELLRRHIETLGDAFYPEPSEKM